MSISEAQLEANRLNAQKSTGPATAEGKKRSSLNGMRHGLTGAAFLMTDEDRKAYDAFSVPFIEALNPANPVELQFAHLIAKDHYRLNRIQAIEENTFALGHYGKAGNIEIENAEIHSALTQARVFAFDAKLFQNLSLYEQRITRNMHRNLKALHDLQDRRKAEERLAALEAKSKPDRSGLRSGSLVATTALAETAHRGQGFGFSTPQMTPNSVPEAQTTPPIDLGIAA